MCAGGARVRDGSRSRLASLAVSADRIGAAVSEPVRHHLGFDAGEEEVDGGGQEAKQDLVGLYMFLYNVVSRLQAASQ